MDRDLYYLVKFLPAYALPAGKPSRTDLTQPDNSSFDGHTEHPNLWASSVGHPTTAPDHLPVPVTTSTKFYNKKTTFLTPDPNFHDHLHRHRELKLRDKEQIILSSEDEKYLFPAYMPPKYHFFDLFPFSLLVGTLTAHGKDVKGKKAAKIRDELNRRKAS